MSILFLTNQVKNLGTNMCAVLFVSNALGCALLLFKWGTFTGEFVSKIWCKLMLSL